MAVEQWAVTVLAPNTTHLRTITVDAADAGEASRLARIERAMTGPRPCAPRDVHVSGVRRVVRPTGAAQRVAAPQDSGSLHAAALLDADVRAAMRLLDGDPLTIALPSLVRTRPLARPRGLRASLARVLLWVAGHVTWGRASFALLTLALRVSPLRADGRRTLLACLTHLRTLDGPDAQAYLAHLDAFYGGRQR